MERKILRLDEFTESLAEIRRYTERQADDGRHKAMLCILKRAVEGELTLKQRECVELYYFQGQRMVQIARELEIDPSTVSKHLDRARKKLAKVMQYYFPKSGSSVDSC